MTSSRPVAGGEGAVEAQPILGFRAQLATLLGGLRGAPERRVLLLLAGAVLAVILLTAAAQVALNDWNRPFYNAISNRQVSDFLRQVGVFFAIAGTLLVLNVTQMWLSLMMQLKLRAGLMHDLLDRWLAPGRAFRLAHAGAVLGVNPDQRLHEDTRHLAELSTTLAFGLLQSTVLLVVFAVVLWRITTGFIFFVAGRSIDIPGYMVWAAVLYALVGSLASFRVGSSLLHQNAERYGREAELRYSLARISQQIDTIALHRGEASERHLLDLDLGHVYAAMRKLVTATTGLTWVTSGYGWLTQVVPILVAAPVYFDGHISFGGLMLAVGAFNQVQSSLRWFVDNFSAIADWRATLLRVADFHRAVTGTDELHKASDQIAIERGPPGQLALEEVAVAAADSCTRLVEGSLTVASGERVQITGESGDSETLFFRALAGMWPWGQGRIRLPGDEHFMHVVRRPYVRPGRLRDVLAYPDDPAAFADASFPAALEAVGLGELVGRLDENARWDQQLGDQDLQRLAFARLALQRPAWIVIDQALETLDDTVREQVVAMLQTMLAEAAVINIGRAGPGDALFGKTLTLVEDPGGCRLAGATPAGTPAGTAGAGLR